MTASKKAKEKTPKSVPLYKKLWASIIKALPAGGLFALIALVLEVFNGSFSLIDRFYQPTPTEISIKDSPIRILYDKESGLTINAQVSYVLEVHTYLIDHLDQDRISISDYKLRNRSLINSSHRNIQISAQHGSSWAIGENNLDIHGIGYDLNVRLTLSPSISKAKTGKIYTIGYAVFSVPYYKERLRKVKEKKIPIELVVK